MTTIVSGAPPEGADFIDLESTDWDDVAGGPWRVSGAGAGR
ncbi:MAG: hypothetical protein ACK496_08810 [Acidobacteriota bacterium]